MEADIEADIGADRREAIGLMEPMRLGHDARGRGRLLDLALELTDAAAGLRTRLPAPLGTPLQDLVRTMNCYYSNLIEDHNTHPVDIERAMHQDYSADPMKRDLQLEARAHVHVQRWIDGGGLAGRAATSEGLRDTHRRFCEELPDDLLWIVHPQTGERFRVEPGEYRRRDVRVGQHQPVSPGALLRFMARFEEAFTRLGRADGLLAVAAAHHRFAWIHPFLDGNGRVGRLMSHAMLSEALQTGGLWSIARGLAKNLDSYRGGLAACDQPRRNDLDGRGSLSEEALADFSAFFLETCLDQVRFMEGLMEPARLSARVLSWADQEARLGVIAPRSGEVLNALLYRGELPKAEVEKLLGVTDRQARRVTAPLVELGVLTSKTVRDPYRLGFPARLAPLWMPGLFPAQA